MRELRRSGADPDLSWVLARLEGGELDRGRVRLAAYLGDTCAFAALVELAGDDAAELFPAPWSPFCRSHEELVTWLGALPQVESVWLHRAAWVAARAWVSLYRAVVLPALEEGWTRDRLGEALRVLVPALELASFAPGDEERRRAVAVGSQTLRYLGSTGVAHVGQVVSQLSRLVSLYGARHVDRRLRLLVIADADRPPSGVSTRACVRFSVGDGRVRNLLRTELVPLLLA